MLKNDIEILKEIEDNKSRFLENFKDIKNYLWAKKYYLFPDVDNVEYIQQKLKIIKTISKFSKDNEEKHILMILVDLILSQNEIQRNIPLYKKVSEYVKNLLKDFPNALICEILTQLSKEK